MSFPPYFYSAAATALLLLSSMSLAQTGGAQPSGNARTSGDYSSAVAKYVDRSWEVSSIDYTIKQLKDEDRLLVFRVKLRPDKDIAPPLFRVFDIYVDPKTATVVGERQVR